MTRNQSEIRLIPISLADEIRPGDPLADRLLASLRKRRAKLQSGDILVVKHKIVSKAEGRIIDLATVQPCAESIQWAQQYSLDARVIELSLREARAVIRRQNGVIITDSFGRPWREGLTEFAIGVAGMKPLRDDRNRRDPHGYKLKASVEAVADELACAAGLVCGKLNRTPACIVRGYSYEPAAGTVKDLLRPAKTDLFR